ADDDIREDEGTKKREGGRPRGPCRLLLLARGSPSLEPGARSLEPLLRARLLELRVDHVLLLVATTRGRAVGAGGARRCARGAARSRLLVEDARHAVSLLLQLVEDV